MAVCAWTRLAHALITGTSPYHSGMRTVSPHTHRGSSLRRQQAVTMLAEKDIDLQVLKNQAGAATKAKTLSDSTRAFYSLWGAIPIMEPYRRVVDELLTAAHFAKVDVRFTYDPIFALGFATVFDRLTDGYPPGESEKQRLFDCLAKAVDEDPSKMRGDAQKLKEWVTGKGGSSEILSAFNAAKPGDKGIEGTIESIKANPLWLYNRVWGVGLYTMMEMANTEVTQESVTEWMSALDCNYKFGGPKKCFTDYTVWSANLQRLREVQKVFKEMEIRRKKDLAEKLEARAKELQEKESKLGEPATAASTSQEPAPVASGSESS